MICQTTLSALPISLYYSYIIHCIFHNNMFIEVDIKVIYFTISITIGSLNFSENIAFPILVIIIMIHI